MSMPTLADCVGYADTNPDIAGVGVRISFYLQAFLLVLLVDRSWEDAPLALWTFIVTSFGISLAAIIQRDQLSFFQALQLSNLIWLANFGIFFALGAYSRQRAEVAVSINEHGLNISDFKVKYGAMAQTIFSMILTLYMWSEAPTFGNQSQCSPFLKYVLFVFEVPALGVGRYIGLTMSSLLMSVYVCISIRDIQSSRKQSRLGLVQKPSIVKPGSSSAYIPRVSTSDKNLDEQASKFVAHASLRSSGASPTRQGSSALPPLQLSSSMTRRPKRRRWSFDIDPMFVGIVICQVMVFTYFVVSSEVLLRRNPTTSDGATQWGFGQVLALIVVTPSALSVIDAFSRHGLRRMSKRKKRGSGMDRR